MWEQKLVLWLPFLACWEMLQKPPWWAGTCTDLLQPAKRAAQGSDGNTEKCSPTAIHGWDQTPAASFSTPASRTTPETLTLRLSFIWKASFLFSSNQTSFLKLWVLNKSLRRTLAGTKQTAWRMALESPSVTYMLYFATLSQHLALYLCFSQPNQEWKNWSSWGFSN